MGFLSPDADYADDTQMLAYARGLRNAQAHTDEIRKKMSDICFVMVSLVLGIAGKRTANLV